jgi:hypothetical protein
MGLDNIGTGEMTQMAGGGILAFADTGSVPDANENAFSIPRNAKGQPDELAWMERMATKYNTESPAVKAQREALEAGIAERKKSMGYEGLTRFGLDMMAGTSPYALTNVGGAGKTALDFMSGEGKDIAKDREKLLELKSNEEKNKEAREQNMFTNYTKLEKEKRDRALTLLSIQATRDATKAAQLATNQQNAAKIYADTLTKNTLALRKYFSDTGLPADENEIQLDAERTTYAAFKNSPKGTVMSDYMAGVAEPEARKPKEAAPKKQPGFFENLFGGSKAVDFNQLPTK